ncbi:MAG: RHS repeat-associated core domain-containing protein [Sulfuricellaceae bacterium]
MFSTNTLRRIVALVLLTFTSLTLQPLQAAQTHPLEQPRSQATPPSLKTERYAQLLEAMKHTAQKGAGKAAKGQNSSTEAKLLRQQKNQLEALEIAVEQQFSETAQQLKNKNLPTEILTRQQAALAQFKSKQAELKAKLRALDSADDSDQDTQRGNAVNDLAGFLGSNQKPDPLRAANRLPFHNQSDKVRAPIDSKEAYKRAQPRALAIDTTAPTANDLAETEDVQLTPAIRALAAALNNSPVKIHYWVRNNIEFLPTYGSIQGADLTLQSRRGNAFDTASLEIALLRAAGIPARYVYGTIQLPVDKVMNWVGGVASADAALNLLAQGGIPSSAVAAGGAVGAVKLEHVWVEAWVDYIPSRGAVNKVGDTWAPLDASFKLSGDKPGLDLPSAVSLNAQGVLDSARQGATCDATSGQGINSANLLAAYNGFAGSLNNFLGQQGADLTVGDVLGGRTIVGKDYAILPGTLPYRTVAVGARYSALPDSLRWSLRYAFYNSAAERAQNQALGSFNASLPGLAGKRLTLSFVPASPLDADTLAAYLPQPHADGSPASANEFPADLPAYLIHVKAELRADGQVVASGGDFVLGSRLVSAVGLFSPIGGTWEDSLQDITAGEYQALAIDGQGIAAAQIAALQTKAGSVKSALAAKQYATLGRDDATGLLLQQAALGYFALADANARIYRRASGAVDVRMPSYAFAVARVEPEIVLGVIVKAKFPGVALSVERYAQAVVAKQNTPLAAYKRQAMERASAYAHLILEYLMADAAHPGAGVSAVKALTQASIAGQKIQLLNAANVGASAPLLQIDETSKTEILNAASSGMQILAEDGVIIVGGWSGSGYIVEDAVQGSGDYRLSGDATAVLYPAGGAPWLALAAPALSGAAIAPALDNSIAFDKIAESVIGGMESTRWQYFPAQSEIVNGLFLSRLNAIQPTSACDTLSSVVTAGIAASSGIGSNSGGSVNHAPVILGAPPPQASAGAPYRYAIQASDPDGDPLSYRIVAGPTGLGVDAGGTVSWSNPAEGAYNITVRVDDGAAYTDQSYLLAVGKGGGQLSAVLTISPKTVAKGETVTLLAAADGGKSATPTLTLTVDGANVALDATGKATVTAATIGAHRVVLTVSDGVTSATREDVYTVADPTDLSAPQSALLTPAQDAEITAPVDITGSATAANFAYYILRLRPAGAPEADWVEIGRGLTPVANGKLGRLDPTRLANGFYELELIAADINGRLAAAVVTVELTRDLKIGQFTLSFRDLDVNAAGIPIRVTRTYDTRRKNQNLDFGYGWSVDYQSVQLRKNMTLGLDWHIIADPMALQVCLRPTGKRKVSITLPDGSLQRFEAYNTQECALSQLPMIDVRFNALPGVTGKLEIVNVPSLVKPQGGVLYDMDNLETWNPKEFKLTTEEGYVYYLKEGVGITQVQDLYGNTLTYGASGILHSNGQSVAFTRDAQGRITAITDPLGNRIRYAYDANGNLIGVTDRLNQQSRLDYNGSHGLTGYTDPAGTALARYNYDADGRLIGVTDASGKSIQANHDLANNRETVTDRLGRTTTYTYDADGNITEKIDPLGQKTTYAFDALGLETRATDPLGYSVTRNYDPQSGKPLSEADPLGNTTTHTYDPTFKTLLATTTDPRGNVTHYSFIGTAPSGIIEPLGRTTRLEYDGKGNLSKLDIAGQATAKRYDAKGNLTSETDAAGNVTSFTYDANGRELSRSWQRTTDSGQKITVTTAKTYDAEGRVISETDELGHTTRNTWNSAGKLTSHTDALGRVTAYQYDASARLIKTTYPDGTSEAISYDAEGNKLSRTDRAGRITRYEYDALNRKVKTVYPDGTFDTIAYDAVGRVEQTRDAKGNAQINRYDAAGRLTASSDALGQTTTHQYDANGNRIQTGDAQGNVTTYAYDALNRLTQTVYPDGSSRSIAWRTDGKKAGETDQNGNTVQYGYDALGRLSQVTLTAGGTAATTTYAYDEVGNKVSQTDAEGKTTRWVYDDANRVVKRVLPNGEAESFEHDALGNRTAHVDFNGRRTSYAYDAANRLVSSIAPDKTATTTYSASGQVATVRDNAGTTRYQYDALDRLTRQDNPDGSFLAYAYDANGNRSQLSTPAGTVGYAYDNLNRLVGVTGRDGKVTAYQYDANGNRIKTSYPNGAQTDAQYDAQNRLTGLTHSLNSKTIRGFQYALLPNGQRAGVIESGASGTLRTLAYSYDSLNRLVGVQATDSLTPANSKTTAFAYGKTGNRTSETVTQGSSVVTTAYQYDADDRLISSTQTSGSGATATSQTTSYAWDAHGNLVKKTDPNQTTLYVWDSENRLTEVKRGTSETTATTVATYRYDANGNRIQKTTPDGKTINYLVDANLPYAQVVEEKSTLGAATESTVYLHGIDLIQQTRGGQGTFYHQDGLGSVRALSDAQGALTDAYDFAVYGGLESRSGAAKNDFLFAGEQFDAEAGLYYNRARWLDTEIGRFVSLDPFAGNPNDPLTLNKYGYASGDPVNNVDPSGLMSMTEVGASLGIAGVGATIAMHAMQSPFAPVSISGGRQPTVWDAIMMLNVAPLGVTVAMARQAALAADKVKPPEKHHTIPKYLCGSENSPDLSLVSYSQHKQLHGGLASMYVMIEAAGAMADRMIPVKLGWRKKTAVRTLGESAKGRGAIAAAIGTFYGFEDIAGWGVRPIGVVFPEARDKYIGLPSDSPCARD